MDGGCRRRSTRTGRLDSLSYLSGRPCWARRSDLGRGLRGTPPPVNPSEICRSSGRRTERPAHAQGIVENLATPSTIAIAAATHASPGTCSGLLRTPRGQAVIGCRDSRTRSVLDTHRPSAIASRHPSGEPRRATGRAPAGRAQLAFEAVSVRSRVVAGFAREVLARSHSASARAFAASLNASRASGTVRARDPRC